MTIIDIPSSYQNYLPRELKHALLILRRKKHWKKQRIIFIHIPKVAGVSVNTAIYGRFMGHMTAYQVRRYALKVFSEYPSFGIVRNPWARCVSAYRFIQASEGMGTTVAGVFNPKQYKSYVFRSFDSFIEEWLVEQNLEEIDYIFQSQLSFISDDDGNIIVSHVGRLEDMNAVQDYISDVIGKKINIGYQNRTGQDIIYQKWYTPRVADLVSQIYSQDITALGYEFE